MNDLNKSSLYLKIAKEKGLYAIEHNGEVVGCVDGTVLSQNLSVGEKRVQIIKNSKIYPGDWLIFPKNDERLYVQKKEIDNDLPQHVIAFCLTETGYDNFKTASEQSLQEEKYRKHAIMRDNINLFIAIIALVVAIWVAIYK